jgi:hypothetical protein
MLERSDCRVLVVDRESEKQLGVVLEGMRRAADPTGAVDLLEDIRFRF